MFVYWSWCSLLWKVIQMLRWSGQALHILLFMLRHQFCSSSPHTRSYYSSSFYIRRKRCSSSSCSLSKSLRSCAIFDSFRCCLCGDRSGPLETKAYTSTLTSFDLLTLRPPKSTWRHWFCESQTEIDATKTERAAILLGFKPNGSKVSCGSNRPFAVLLRGSPPYHCMQGLETWWLLQIWFTNVSLTTFTTWPRSGEQRAAAFSSSCCGT